MDLGILCSPLFARRGVKVRVDHDSDSCRLAIALLRSVVIAFPHQISIMCLKNEFLLVRNRVRYHDLLLKEHLTLK